jgi:allophanate hydrolase
MELSNQSLDIQSLLAGYRDRQFTPREILAEVQLRIERMPEHNAWITLLGSDEIEDYLARVDGESPDSLPLYGIPFAIKDNIDLAAVPTTAACPDYTYIPGEHAFVVEQLIAAGAIPVGKTNLDQFATGLVGTRSPYGPGKNSFNPDYVSGGSSSGSAIAVALGQVSFALGTDTAGSGRVTAAFNNLIGLKPTRGYLSSRGVVPACRSLDCVSILSLTAADARLVLDACDAYDAEDDYARMPPAQSPWFDFEQLKVGVPADGDLEFFGNRDAEALFKRAVSAVESLGGEIIEIDFSPFLEAARLLYEGPWVTERYLAIEEFINARPDSLHPVTREIISAGRNPSASDAFRAQYRLQALQNVTRQAWEQVDTILTPTAGTIYTIEEVENDPIRLNSNLGYYTNFMNLLDLSACALPAGFQQDGLPFGVTLFSPPFNDRNLLPMASSLHLQLSPQLGATTMPLDDTLSLPPREGWVDIVLVGAHMQGLPLNHQMTDRDARFVESTKTSGQYCLYALPGGPPYRPGLVRTGNGRPIDVEVWSMPLVNFGSFVAGIPEPLGIGTIELQDGRQVQGFLCEQSATEDATDITHFGGWRPYLDSQST